MTWSLYRWQVGQKAYARGLNSASAAWSSRYRGEGRSSCRVWLFATATCRFELRWHSGHDRPEIESGILQCRPRQGNQTSVCALEEAELELIRQHNRNRTRTRTPGDSGTRLRSWHKGLASQDPRSLGETEGEKRGGRSLGMRGGCSSQRLPKESGSWPCMWLAEALADGRP